MLEQALGAADNKPVGSDNVDAARRSSFGALDPARVSTSGEMITRKLDDEDLGTVLQSCKCLSRDVTVDGLKCVRCPVVPGHEFLVRPWAASCLPQALGKASDGGFAVDCEAGLRGRNEWGQFGRVGTISGKGVGLATHLGRPCHG